MHCRGDVSAHLLFTVLAAAFALLALMILGAMAV